MERDRLKSILAKMTSLLSLLSTLLPSLLFFQNIPQHISLARIPLSGFDLRKLYLRLLVSEVDLGSRL